MFFFILVLALGAIGMLAGLNLLVFVFALLVAAILSGGLQSGPMMLGFQAAPESIPLLRAGAQARLPVLRGYVIRGYVVVRPPLRGTRARHPSNEPRRRPHVKHACTR